MNLIFLDTETTGLDPLLNDVIEIGFIIEKDNEIKKQASFKCQPHNFDTVEQAALDVNNVKLEDLKTFAEPTRALKMFIKLLRQYVPPGAHSDEKLVMVAHNAKFDYYMVKHWFEKGGEAAAFDELFSYHCIDTVGIAMLFAQWGPLKGKVNRFSLKKLTEFFGIEFDGAAHTAGADIKATRELFKVFTDFFKDE